MREAVATLVSETIYLINLIISGVFVAFFMVIGAVFWLALVVFCFIDDLHIIIDRKLGVRR